MSLLRSVDFEDLPEERIARWLQLRDLIEDRFAGRYNLDGGPDKIDFLEYMEVLAAAAEELEVGTLQPVGPGNIEEEFESFRASVTALATRLSLRRSSLLLEANLRLSKPVQARLHQEISRLRDMIVASDLTDAKKQRLSSLLDQLSKEIDQQQINYARIMKVMALCAAGLGGTTAFLADMPEAIATIAQLVGLQEEAEAQIKNSLRIAKEPAVPMLPTPPKRLAPPEKQ